VGAVLLLLSFFGMGVLPVNWFGLLFLGLAFVLFILDIKAPTHGLLTAAGAGSFIAGALVLFNSVRVPGLPSISVPLVVGVGIFVAASFFIIVSIALKAQKAPVLMGKQAMIGKHGLVRGGLNPEGQVQVAGELWSAILEDESGSLPDAALVEVVAIQGVRLTVKPVVEK
jgi:membrane-bound serine protease (ClpP class)